jgi:GNAT superfamily N-acetyltransferase
VIDELVIRDATEADRDRALALLAAAHGSEVRDAASWDWLYRGNLGRYVVADAGGMLAAQYALLPLRVTHRGEVVNASLSLDTATHPAFAGRGLMTDLGMRAYARAKGELVLGFPNPKSSWILYNRIG